MNEMPSNTTEATHQLDGGYLAADGREGVVVVVMPEAYPSMA